MKTKEIKTLKELKAVLSKIPIKNEDHRKTIICSLIGHSKICTYCFGYRNCGRCGDQLGDNLGSVDYGNKTSVIIDHNCKTCKANYKKCTWKDKYLVPNPFKSKVKKNGKK